MTDHNGRFVWYDLMTTDTAAAGKFYANAVGWTVQDSKMPGKPYWIFAMGEDQLAGMTDLPDQAKEMGAPPHWMGHVHVADVDASAALATASGGKILMPPMDIPEVGRFAIIADPQGAVLSIYHSSMEKDDKPEPAMATPGRVGWHELYTSDLEGGFAFYEKLFGWVKKDAMDMGEMGTYQLFGIGEITLGGMMNKPPNVPVSSWCYYFNVPDIKEGAERVKAAGGQIVHGPMEVPGGGWIVMAIDPQGAAFALFAPK